MSRTRAAFSVVYNEIARRMMLHQEPSEIAQATLIREDTILRIMRRPEFMEILQRLQDKTYAGVDRTLESDARDIRAEIKMAASASFDRLKDLLDKVKNPAASDSIVVNVAQDLLDRAGFGKTVKIEADNTLIIDALDAEILAAALERERKGRERLGDKPIGALLKSGQEIEETQGVTRNPNK